jgi:hypothetical protein
LVDDYVKKLEIKGLERKIFQTASFIPLVVYKVEPEHMTEQTKNVMVYGHLDK